MLVTGLLLFVEYRNERSPTDNKSLDRLGSLVVRGIFLLGLTEVGREAIVGGILYHITSSLTHVPQRCRQEFAMNQFSSSYHCSSRRTRERFAGAQRVRSSVGGIREPEFILYAIEKVFVSLI